MVPDRVAGDVAPAIGIEDGDSPQTVFKAAQAAGAKKDFVTLTKLVAPSEHAMLSFGTDMAVGMFAEFYEGEKAEALTKKYQKIQKSCKSGLLSDICIACCCARPFR